MRTKLTSSVTTIALGALIVWSSVGVERAYSAGLLDLIPGLGSLTGNTVTIVGDVSPNTVKNTVNTALTLARTVDSLSRLSSIDIKERVLDPIAWNVAKKLQQQLTGNMLKWLGGQMPGQNGEIPFVTNYSEYYGEIRDGVAGEVIFGSTLTGLCSPEQDFQVRKAVYDSYVESRNDQQVFSCEDTNNSNTAQKGTVLEKMFKNTVNCDGTTACAVYKGKRVLAEREANALDNERFLLELSGGMKVQKACRVIQDPDGKNRQVCEIVTPPYVAREKVTQELVRAPSEQLLQIDEFNEIVSDWVSNLATQALTGLGGVLGMSGNPVFGPTGNLSYADQLLNDDISLRQSFGKNPIKSSIEAEQKYISLQNQVLNRVTDLENQKAAAPSCSSLSVPVELTNAKNNALNEIAYSNLVLNGDPTKSFPEDAALLDLDQAYASTTNSEIRGQIMMAYSELQGSGELRSEADNQQFESQYINYEFSLVAEQFQCQLTACGASGTCILSSQ